jgi:hypothetical protein
MACHTWFYKKVDDPSLEKIKSVVQDKCLREIQFLERLINDRESIDADLLEAYPEWTSEWANGLLSPWKKVYDFVNGGDLNLNELPEFFLEHFTKDINKEDFLYELYEMWEDSLLEYIPEKGLYQEAEYRDLFRKYGYPEDRLFSLEETLSYINDPANKCSVYDWTVSKLEEFWQRHPHGMIQFG